VCCSWCAALVVSSCLELRGEDRLQMLEQLNVRSPLVTSNQPDLLVVAHWMSLCTLSGGMCPDRLVSRPPSWPDFLCCYWMLAWATAPP
jgi:hypothetical protein